MFFKRNDAKEWHGPGVVIGRDGKQVLVKHGGTYVRVHVCRLSKYPINSSEITNVSDGNESVSQLSDEIVNIPSPAPVEDVCYGDSCVPESGSLCSDPCEINSNNLDRHTPALLEQENVPVVVV